MFVREIKMNIEYTSGNHILSLRDPLNQMENGLYFALREIPSPFNETSCLSVGCSMEVTFSVVHC